MEIVGIVKSVIFEASDSSYKVLKISTNHDEVVVTGIFPFINIYEKYSFTGDMVNNEKYGEQFKVTSYQKIEYTDKDGLINYLSSKNFKGIGKKIATRLVEEIGLDCISKIKKDSSILKKMGLSKDKADNICKALIDNEKEEEIYIKLYSYGLTAKMAFKIYMLYENLAIEKIEKNPYCLVNDLEGFGFMRADHLAANLGIKPNDPSRVNQGVVYVLTEACNQKGYTFLTKAQLVKTASALLNRNKPSSVNDDEIEKSIKGLINDNKISLSNEKYYPSFLYKAEKNAYKRFIELKAANFKAPKKEKIESYITNAENNLGFTLTDLQRDAILKTAMSKISIITGGPGTGKTTIVKALLMVLASTKKETIFSDTFRQRTLLLAPTGKAAKRLALSTGINAETIHHALGYNELGEFKKSSLDPIEETLIIIDEASMIDISLLSTFLDAVKNSSTLVFVGDSNQLPSVGPGNVLNDMIDSRLFQTTMLKEIMRQKSDSNIIKLSQMILSRKIDYNIFNSHKEVFFYNADAASVLDNIEKLYTLFIKKGGDIKKDIQVLAPMYSGVCGIDAINKMIQEKFNNNPVILEKNNKAYKIGDKVLQLQNNPDLGIMNGDDGFILDYEKKDKKEILYINFGEKIVEYNTDELENLTLGYAISIHKSQGSEYENVIIPIVPSFYIMLKPKLIYTAITRAKSKLIILGKPEALNTALYQDDEKRQTSLFPEEMNENQHIYINDPEIPFDTLGEEGMENISPYDFMD